MSEQVSEQARAMELARRHHRAGRLAEAEPLYRRIWTDHGHADAVHALSILSLQLGKTADALELVNLATASAPDEWRYQCTRGQILNALGHHADAVAAYRRAADLEPNSVEAHYGLGLALQANGAAIEAVAAYQRAVTIKPDHVEAHNNLGNALQGLRRFDEAIRAYEQALSLRPDYVEAQNNLASALQAAGRVEEAIAIFRQALTKQPGFVPLYINLANALRTLRKLDEAAAMLRQALVFQPDSSQAWYNLGNVLRDQGEFAPAIDAFGQAIALCPDYWQAHTNLGNVLQMLGQFKEAAAAYLKALTIKPDNVDAYANLGAALQKMGRIDEAIDFLRQAIFLRPDFHIAHCNLGNLLKDRGDLDGAIACFNRALELRRDDAISHSNLAYTVHYHPDYDGPAILRENLRWNVMHAAKFSREIAPHENNRDPSRRLKIGYVSPDFRNHCQSMFTIPLLGHHDHERHKIYCYANVARPDAVTERIIAMSDVWRGTVGLSDEQIAGMVREDRIDILIDLTMHMSNGRPLLFARKPAPVQVAWLAYPGTTGLSAIDYRLTDPYLDPRGETDCFYSEQSIRLPDSFWCYDPLTDELSPNELPALRGAGVTFGCLNNFCKVNEPTLSLWGRVMNAVPQSRLLLLSAPGKHRQAVLDRFAEMGVAADRIEFIPFQPRGQYLRTHHQIDIGLDTFPYNGHTTTLDSLWMGVPVVTYIGRTSVGRAGWSQLSNLGLPELAGKDENDFVRLAVELAGDLNRLSRLRSELRPRLLQSPLCDGARFARNVEQAYRAMWRTWCASLQP
jgi:predicted O-linked N-acetylglucosamine transferase (SPINDLY family)